MGKKLDLKGSNFKLMRGLDISTVTSLLKQLTKEELSIPEMAKECKKVKSLRDLQKAFIDEPGVKTWKKAEEKFPHLLVLKSLISSSRETLRKSLIAIGNPQLVGFVISATTFHLLHESSFSCTMYRFKSFCKSALHSVECAETISPSDGIFQHERSIAYVLPTQTISYSSINSLCLTSRMPFKDFALTLINFSDLNTDEGEVHYVCIYGAIVITATECLFLIYILTVYMCQIIIIIIDVTSLLFQTLEVLVRSISSINTMGEAMTFVIGVVCDHESYPDVQCHSLIIGFMYVPYLQHSSLSLPPSLPSFLHVHSWVKFLTNRAKSTLTPA